MKRSLFIILLAICCCMAWAQPGNGHGRIQGPRPNFEKFLQDRVNFVTHVMELEPADSVRFVPLYMDMLKEKGELMFKRPHQHIRHDMTYPDSVYTNAAEREIEFKLEDAKIEMKYLRKFQSFLSPKQVFSWIQAEKMFIGSFMRKGRGQAHNAEK